jgi:hypothetical protein
MIPEGPAGGATNRSERAAASPPKTALVHSGDERDRGASRVCAPPKEAQWKPAHSAGSVRRGVCARQAECAGFAVGARTLKGCNRDAHREYRQLNLAKRTRRPSSGLHQHGAVTGLMRCRGVEVTFAEADYQRGPVEGPCSDIEVTFRRTNCQQVRSRSVAVALKSHFAKRTPRAGVRGAVVVAPKSHFAN